MFSLSCLTYVLIHQLSYTNLAKLHSFLSNPCYLGSVHALIDILFILLSLWLYFRHTEFVTSTGEKHTRVQFHLKGQFRTAIVHAETFIVCSYNQTIFSSCQNLSAWHVVSYQSVSESKELLAGFVMFWDKKCHPANRKHPLGYLPAFVGCLTS